MYLVDLTFKFRTIFLVTFEELSEMLRLKISFEKLMRKRHDTML